MKYEKYILVYESGMYDFRCGYVEYHAHLATDAERRANLIDGGGRFVIDENKKEVRLWGSSDDFGYPKNIEKALKQCYNQLMRDINEYYYYKTNGEKDLNMDEFKLVYVDQNNEGHEIPKRK